MGGLDTGALTRALALLALTAGILVGDAGGNPVELVLPKSDQLDQLLPPASDA
jgi:hypothetical protein